MVYNVQCIQRNFNEIFNRFSGNFLGLIKNPERVLKVFGIELALKLQLKIS